MCLDVVSAPIFRKITINNLEFDKDGYAQLWKVFEVDSKDNLMGQYHDYRFQEGKNTANGDKIFDFGGGESYIQYQPGFHCFITKEDAITWEGITGVTRDRIKRIIPIKVKRSWITSIGTQDYMDVVVCKHIIIEKENVCV